MMPPLGRIGLLILFALLGTPAPAQAPVTSYRYDAEGNLIARQGPLPAAGALHDLTTYTYDALNRLIQETNPLAGITRYSYDGLGQLSTVTDPRGLVTRYTVDGLGKLSQEVSPDRGSLSARHDAAGNRVAHTDARGRTATYTYDALDRLTGVAFQDGSALGYRYDEGDHGIGRLTATTWPGGETRFAYDPHGRVTRKQDQHAGGPRFEVGYTYQDGRLTQLGYPSGRILHLDYDAAGQVAGLSLDATPLATHIRYLPFGAPASWIWGHGTVAARRFDQDGRPTELPFTARGLRQIGYDPASRITALSDPAQRAHDQTYTYDLLDRLTGWTSYGSWQRFHYDANGNRTRVERNGQPYDYTTAADSNRLLSAAGSERTRVFRHDAAGQIVGDGLITWSYNDRGRLAAVTLPGPVIGQFIRVDPAGVRHVSVTRGAPISVRYTHDAFGQRLRKTGTLGTTHFVYDEQGQLLGEYDASGAVRQEYVYLAGHLLGIVRGPNAEIFYAYTDPVGRPWVVTDAEDRPRWHWPLAPFGDWPPSENPSGLGPFTLNLRFPGQYFDKETSTHYNYFRDYDPAIGRYLQTDPIGLAGGINIYAYVENNPISKSDPEGLFGIGGAAGGAAVSIGMQMFICSSLGGALATCLKCINWTDVGVSAAMGAVFPTWLGDVGKSMLGVSAATNALTKLGGPGLGGITRQQVIQNARGATASTVAGAGIKTMTPNRQLECDDECAKYRLPKLIMGIGTSIF